jgi:hypothetical protein
MNLSVTEAHQHEMRHAYYDGAPGILVSGIVWTTAALVCLQFGFGRAVWTLLIGGALIHPIGTLVAKAIGRPARTDRANALNQLAAASTVWLILNCAMAFGLSLLAPTLFFPAMLATIGSRYLILATVFGRSVFWALGVTLLGAAGLSFYLSVAPTATAALGGAIEVVFAAVVFSKASTRAGS